jgi:hypothetical protein
MRLCENLRIRHGQRLEADIVVLRHQLNVLQERAPRRRLHLRWVDRALCVPKTSSVLIARPNRLNVRGDDRAALLLFPQPGSIH